MKAILIVLQLGLLIGINFGCSSNSHELTSKTKVDIIKPPIINQQLFDTRNIELINEEQIFIYQQNSKLRFFAFIIKS